jgi:microcystin-dependent protein
MEPFVGEIRIVGFNFEPEGWAFCDGRLLAVAEYNALFSLLGTMYGGDGRTTFALPDLRGRGPVNFGDGPGLTPVRQGELGGAESVTLTEAELPPHAPEVSVNVADPATTSNDNLSGEPSNNSVLGPIEAAGRAGDLYSTDNANVNLKPFDAEVNVSPVGGGQSVPVRSPYLGLNFVIALKGVYSPRS